MTTPYDDIINLPHYEPQNHRRMSMEARAAQFSSFAALNGHEEAINETARLTDRQIELDGDDIAILNRKMRLILSRLAEKPTIEVTYFQPDALKQGGAYLRHKGIPKKIDDYAQSLIFTDRKSIPLSSILDISSPLFDET